MWAKLADFLNLAENAKTFAQKLIQSDTNVGH